MSGRHRQPTSRRLAFWDRLTNVLIIAIPLWLVLGGTVVRLFGGKMRLDNRVPSENWLGNLIWLGGFALLIVATVFVGHHANVLRIEAEGDDE